MIKKFKDIAKEDRPREKLLSKGVGNLKDWELIAIILGSGTKGSDIQEISKNIFNRIKKNKYEADLKTFDGIKGVGEAKRATLVAACELWRRLSAFNPRKKEPCQMADIKYLLRNVEDIRVSPREHFIIFFLDTRSKEIERYTVSVGTLNASLVHPREVFSRAVECNAAQVIAVHNHPSNECSPSDADLLITERLVEVGKILGIEFVDHIVISRNDHYSIRDNHSDIFNY